MWMCLCVFLCECVCVYKEPCSFVSSLVNTIIMKVIATFNRGYLPMANTKTHHLNQVPNPLT